MMLMIVMFLLKQITFSNRSQSDLHLPETIVAVFAPSDIESLTSSSCRGPDSNPYYAGDAAISTIKCVMSTLLFLAVVAIIVAVAIIKNPGM